MQLQFQLRKPKQFNLPFSFYCYLYLFMKLIYLQEFCLLLQEDLSPGRIKANKDLFL